MTEDAAAWWVYLLQCNDQSLYVGITTDLQRRLQEHNGATPGGARYTRSRRPVRLVWSEPSDSRSAAAQREAAIRKLSRNQKEQLIQASVGNPSQ